MSPNGDSFRELCQRKLCMQLSILERTDRYEFQSLGELYDGTTRLLHVPHDIAKRLATWKNQRQSIALGRSAQYWQGVLGCSIPSP